MKEGHDNIILLRDPKGPLDKTNFDSREDLQYLRNLEQKGLEYQLVRDSIGLNIVHVFVSENGSHINPREPLLPLPFQYVPPKKKEVERGFLPDEEIKPREQIKKLSSKPFLQPPKPSEPEQQIPLKQKPAKEDGRLETYLRNSLLNPPPSTSEEKSRMHAVAKGLTKYLKKHIAIKRRELNAIVLTLTEDPSLRLTEKEALDYSNLLTNPYLENSGIKSMTLREAVYGAVFSKRINLKPRVADVKFSSKNGKPAGPVSRQIFYYRSESSFLNEFIMRRIRRISRKNSLECRYVDTD